MWYDFRQNNSGGSFVTDEDKGIGVQVWIEADSTKIANELALKLGLYFDGVEKDLDCPCCGDRWYEAHQEYDAPVIDTVYDFYWHPAIYFHTKDGLLRITQNTLDGVLTDVDIPMRQDLFCYVSDGSPDMLKVWKWKHTLYGETIHNFLMGPE